MSLAFNTESYGTSSLRNTSTQEVDSVDNPPLGQKEYITHWQAMARLRNNIKSCSRIALYCFNVRPELLESAHKQLNKMSHRRAMRVTYSVDHNFIVKFMPSGAHESAHRFLEISLVVRLLQLGGVQELSSLGLRFLGSKTHVLEGGKKEPDSCIVPRGADSPSVVIEAGNSESLLQLRNDAQQWLESNMVNVQLVIVISIDPPIAPHMNLPRITIEHWKSVPPPHPLCSPRAQQKLAVKVWEDNWTHAVTPGYSLLLEDIFVPGEVPVIYGAHTHVHFALADLVEWRQSIIDEWL